MSTYGTRPMFVRQRVLGLYYTFISGLLAVSTERFTLIYHCINAVIEAGPTVLVFLVPLSYIFIINH